jgi:hypothetical protein
MQMDCIPAGMELFPAADEEQWAFIRKVIDDSAESKFRLKGKCDAPGQSHKTTWETDHTWNEIIALLGPHLFQALSEDKANSELAASICSSILNPSCFGFDIDNEVFNTMKIQLLALGYIDIQSLNTKGGGRAVFFTLTPLGKEVMLQMRTVKSSA